MISSRFRFLLQCLEDLDQNLKKINSRLFVVRGQATNVLPKLFQEWGALVLFRAFNTYLVNEM